jgi:hypothetical protein
MGIAYPAVATFCPSVPIFQIVARRDPPRGALAGVGASSLWGAEAASILTAMPHSDHLVIDHWRVRRPIYGPGIPPR